MKGWGLALAAAWTSVGLTSPAFAQPPPATPRYDVSAGYQPLFVTGDSSSTFPLGLAVDFAANAGPSAFIVEGGWSMRSEGDEPDDIRFQFWHAGAGYRWTSRKRARIWPYAQGLIGPAFHETRGEVLGTDQADTSAHFMVQSGGGVNFIVSDRLGIFSALDYRRVFLDEETDGNSGLNEFRVFVGVRLLFH